MQHVLFRKRRVPNLITLALVASSISAFAGPASAPAPISKPPLIVRIGQTIEHLPGIIAKDISSWWGNGGKQQVDTFLQNEIANIGLNMLADLANGGQFNAQADVISGTFTSLHSAEGTGQLLSPEGISNFVGQTIPDNPKVAGVVADAITQGIQTAVVNKGVTPDQAMEIVISTLQPQVTAAAAAMGNEK